MRKSGLRGEVLRIPLDVRLSHSQKHEPMPVPIEPTIWSSTSTRASLTRCTNARITRSIQQVVSYGCDRDVCVRACRTAGESERRILRQDHRTVGAQFPGPGALLHPSARLEIRASKADTPVFESWPSCMNSRAGGDTTAESEFSRRSWFASSTTAGRRDSNWRNGTFTLEYESTIPLRLGMGGSSAIITAALRALCAYFQSRYSACPFRRNSCSRPRHGRSACRQVRRTG